MNEPRLSVIVPALNEERCIERFLDEVPRCLDSWEIAWELLVVDDGSVDTTAAKVQARARTDTRIRLIRQAHGGKGAAIRRGMLAARGAWRFMADADLSVAPEDWRVFLGAARDTDGPAIVIGSREGPNAQRIGEPVARHLIGRVFNWVVQLGALPGLTDTQCGFKLISGEAATAICPHLTIVGFAFDVELLFLARRAGFRIREVGVVWRCREESRVRLSRGAAAFVDILRIRWRFRRGAYAGVRRARGDVDSGVRHATL